MIAKAKLTPYEVHEQAMMERHTASVFQNMNDATIVPVETITSGSLVFDGLIEAGGWMLRGISHVWGKESVGKTTANLSGAAQNSRKGKVRYIDVELRIPKPYFDSIILANGGNPENIKLVRPADGSEVLGIMEDMVGWDTAIYIDTIARVKPPKMLNPTAPDQHFMGSQSKFVGDAIDRVSFVLGRTGLDDSDLPNATALVLVNQARADYNAKTGDKIKPYGGFAQGHGISVSIKMGSGFVNKERTGATVTGWVVKNSIGRPRAKGETGIVFHQGIDLGLDTLLAGVKAGLIEAKGSYYYLNGDLLNQGRPRAGEALLKMGWDDLYAFRDKIRAAIIAGKEKEPDEPIQAAE